MPTVRRKPEVIVAKPDAPMPLWFSNVRQDIKGGLVSALVAIPLAIGYGMFAFVSLGESYFAYGAIAGLYTAFVLGIVCLLLGDKTTTVYAPRINSTFFLGIFAYGLVHSDSPLISSGGPKLVLAIFFFVVILGGAFQALFGLIRLGTLIKFIPHPVVAGFQNAAAALLFLVQLANVCGLERHISFTQMRHHLLDVSPVSLVIAAITFFVMWNSKKALPKVPPLFVGIAVGSALYYGLLLTGFGGWLGPVIGSYPPAMMPSTVSYISDFWQGKNILALLPTIVGGALALAIIASIDALLCAKLATPAGDKTVESNALLMRLGAGNMVSGMFGGITSGINIGASITNRNFGGRTPLAVLVNAAFIIAAAASFWYIGALLPQVTLSACIMVIAAQHFDAWSLKLPAQIFSRIGSYRRIAAFDLLIVLVVAALSVMVDIVLAVFIGIAIAVLMFVYLMSRGIVRRSYRCDIVHSRKSRDAKARRILDQFGQTIIVMELQGALFFGSGERLTNEIETAMHVETHCIILDLRRVTEIDITGAQVLIGIGKNIARDGKHLLIAVTTISKQATRLADFEVITTLTPEKVFPDVDRAIEWAEEDLLHQSSHKTDNHIEIPLGQISLLSGFAPNEVSTLKPRLTRAVYEKGKTVFQEGDLGDKVFMIAQGTASVFIKQPNGGTIRLATFATGTVFGELALLDDGVRSASVMANNALICYSLSKKNFAALAKESPPVAIKLILALGRELSSRLRTANRTIYQLES